MRDSQSETDETNLDLDDEGDASVDLFEMLKTDHRRVQA